VKLRPERTVEEEALDQAMRFALLEGQVEMYRIIAQARHDRGDRTGPTLPFAGSDDDSSPSSDS
jgi:hypothetical protein